MVFQYFASQSSLLNVRILLENNFDLDSEIEEPTTPRSICSLKDKGSTVETSVVSVKSPEAVPKTKLSYKPTSVAEVLQSSTDKQMSYMEKKLVLEGKKVGLAEKRAEIDQEERRMEKYEERQEREKEREHELAKLKLQIELAKAGIFQ